MKKRPILMFAAVLTVAASPIAAELAFAKDGQGRGQGRGRAEGQRGYERRGDDGPRYERRGPQRGPERRGPDRRDERRDYQRHDNDRRPSGAHGPRPGGRLPPEARGPPVADYPRYRLRAPPAGYAWRRAGDAFVLTDREGRIFDVIPD